MKILNLVLLLLTITCVTGQNKKQKIKCENISECEQQFEQMLSNQNIIFTTKKEEGETIFYQFHDIYQSKMPGWGYYREENQIEGEVEYLWYKPGQRHHTESLFIFNKLTQHLIKKKNQKEIHIHQVNVEKFLNQNEKDASNDLNIAQPKEKIDNNIDSGLLSKKLLKTEEKDTSFNKIPGIIENEK